MPTFTLWLSATRPKTLFASISPVLFGSAFAISEGYFKGSIFILTLITALLIQICTNFANDYFDGIKGADTEKRKGPLRLIQSGLVTKGQMKLAIALIFLLTAFCGSLLSYYGGPIIAFLTGLSLILSLLYTAGPLPLAYVGLGDVFVLLFFGPIATSATYFLQASHFSLISFLAGFIPGTLSTAILVINNLRDVQEDKIANKKTLAVRIGEGFTKKEYLTLIATSYVLILGFSALYPYTLLSLFTAPYAYQLVKKVMRNDNKNELNLYLFETGKLMLYITLLFCIGKMLP